MDNLVIDFYELTMGQGYFNNNTHETQACFDLFFRKCPDSASFALGNGVQKCLEYLKNFHFTDEDIEYLRSQKIFSEEYLYYLRTIKFTGDVYAVPDGTVVLPNEPAITIVAPLIQAQLVETALLVMFNHSSLITSKTSRIVRSAKGRAVMEFGTRRAQGSEAAVEGAVDAYVGGAVGTACTLAGKLYGVPVLGTMAHSFVQSFDNEYDAFKAYALSFPDNATLLVDTYDTLRSGVPNAIKVAKEVLEPMGKTLAGIRIDSGDLAYLTKKAREMLDEAGLNGAKICVSNSLDENVISNLLSQGAPIDTFGVGENLITAKSNPVFGGVYKLVAIEKNGELVPKIKISDNIEKVTNPGFKDIVRLYDENGKIISDMLTLFGEPLPTMPIKLKDPNAVWRYKIVKNYTAKHIREKMMENGTIIYDLKTVEERRANVQRQLDTLWDENKRLLNAQTFTLNLSPALQEVKNKLLEQHRSEKEKKYIETFDLDSFENWD